MLFIAIKKILKHLFGIFMNFFSYESVICEVNNFPNCIKTRKDFLKPISLSHWQSQTTPTGSLLKGKLLKGIGVVHYHRSQLMVVPPTPISCQIQNIIK